MNVNKVESVDVTGISLVESPANGALICNDVTGCNINDDNTVDVVVLKANDKVYREATDTLDERYLYWSEDSLKDAAHSTYGKQVQTSLNHDGVNSEGISILESHVQDDEWRMKLKVSDEIQGQIRSGKLNGVSIEGLATEKTMLSITDDMDKFKADSEALDVNTRNEIFGSFREEANND